MDTPGMRQHEPLREAPTLEEILQFASQLPDSQAEQFLAKVRPGPGQPDTGQSFEPPQPVYSSWTQFLARTTVSERLKWCRSMGTKPPSGPHPISSTGPGSAGSWAATNGHTAASHLSSGVTLPDPTPHPSGRRASLNPRFAHDRTRWGRSGQPRRCPFAVLNPLRLSWYRPLVRSHQDRHCRGAE